MDIGSALQGMIGVSKRTSYIRDGILIILIFFEEVNDNIDPTLAHVSRKVVVLEERSTFKRFLLLFFENKWSYDPFLESTLLIRMTIDSVNHFTHL